MDHFDALGDVFPNHKFRTIRRSIQRNNDLELALGIVQREAIPQLCFNGLAFVMRRDYECDRRLPVFLFYGEWRDASPDQENRGIAEIYVEHECEAEPEHDLH